MLSETSRAAHETAHAGFFEKRQLQRYAGIWSLWALGVGAVISGHFSGWNYGLAVAGWGGLMVAAAIMALMFLCLVFCIAEMSAALPDAGATYVFARRAMGPWGGFLSGLCDNVEYVLTPPSSASSSGPISAACSIPACPTGAGGSRPTACFSR